MTGRGALALRAAMRTGLAFTRAGLAACFIWGMLGWAPVSTARAQDSGAGSAAFGGDASPMAGRLPVGAWNSDLSAFLSHSPGAFEYTFGAAGWPDAVSRYGAEPERMALTLAGMPFTDLLTGRPLYEMTPEIMVGRLAEGTHGTVITPRAFRDAFPLTLMRYQAAGNAWQDVQVVHAQNRVFGDAGGGEGPGLTGGSSPDSTTGLHTLFGYTGAGGAGG